MSDYKNTLNLPTTDFPMKANLSNREPEILKFWQEINLYQAIRKARKGKKKFILHDGPPYANGHIHIGHALNRTLKDIIVKAKTMSGLDAPFVPGWDCHGLPIELNVEKKFGKVVDDSNAKEFRDACRQYAKSQIDIQREEFKRLGFLADWDNPYITMDFSYEANIIRALAKIIENGDVVHGSKPVHWCVDCGSALAEAEVEYADKKSPAIDVRFTFTNDALLQAKLTPHQKNFEVKKASIPIWTTTPWSLPANQAVAVHPDHEYVLVECSLEHGEEQILLARELMDSAMKRYGADHFKIVATVVGRDLEGLHVQHPFYPREVPIVLGEHVTVDAGTGAVHTAPGHGQDDYLLGIQYKLPIENPVGDDGKFVAGTPLFAGESIYKANNHIIELLKTNGKLLHDETILHSYPHCWRHKTAIIFRATPQWFISMEKQGLRQDAEKEIMNVEWIPSWGRDRILGMIKERPDWCISRQRYWGVPIPLLIHKKHRNIHPHMSEIIETVAKKIEQKGIDAWFELKVEDLLPANEASEYEKSKDVLDVWFDSGVTHFCVLRQREELAYPADLYLEGSDQHRGWFQSSLLSATAIDRTAPYKAVLTHGYTVDAQGRKMSKSIGNVIPPEKIINSLGADILRLWVSATDYRAEITVSDEFFQRTADAYRRIRNTARFLLANLHDFNPEKNKVAYKDMLSLDRFIVDKAYNLQKEILSFYDQYQFHNIYQKLHQFCSIDLGSFYLDVIKDRQYTLKADSVARRSAQTAMYHIIEAMVRWLAPILSFTAEELWKYIPGKREQSVFLATWYEDLQALDSKDAMSQQFWNDVIRVRDAVNKELEVKRNANVIGSGLAASVTLYGDDHWQQVLKQLGTELRFVLITSDAFIKSEKEKTAAAVNTEIPGLYIDVTASDYQKCDRCWHRREDVGHNQHHADICLRCVENIDGEGEKRIYA